MLSVMFCVELHYACIILLALFLLVFNLHQAEKCETLNCSFHVLLLMFQSPEECAVSITNIIRHHESEYLSSLEVETCPYLFIQAYMLT